MASERQSRKDRANSGASEDAKQLQQDREARAKMPRIGDPGVVAPGTQQAGPEVETEEADLQSTYEWGGRLYGPGKRIMVPKGLADLVNIKLPVGEVGFVGTPEVENREDAAHPARGFYPPKQGTGTREGRQG